MQYSGFLTAMVNLLETVSANAGSRAGSSGVDENPHKSIEVLPYNGPNPVAFMHTGI